MTVLERLHSDHAPALLAFEQENRAFFAATIPDRGDDYFAGFDERHAELLAEQAAGLHHFHLVLDDDGAIVGRVNLVHIVDGSAELGYRFAERTAGQGLAGKAVNRTCGLAFTEYGLTVLRAETTLDNAASQAVLLRTGFLPTADITLDGRPGRAYALHRKA